MPTLALIIRGSNVLARPEGHKSGPLPSLSEVEGFMTLIDFIDHGPIRVVESSTGSAPEGWRWIPPMKMQTEADIFADMIGEAMLCAG